MLSVDRIGVIKKLLTEKNSVTVSELTNMFDVSGETIRRDLYHISTEDPMVVRVHGGAYRISQDADLPYDFRQGSMVKEKERIASKCLAEIENGDYLFLDSSTTTLYLSKLLAASGMKLTVITNSLGVINGLCSCESIKLISVGGTYTDNTHSFVGNSALNTLSYLHATKAFISCSGIAMPFGISHNSEDEAAVRKAMLLNSSKRYLLIDSRKFGRCKPHKILGIEYIDSVWTDSRPEAEWADFFKANNVSVVVC